MAVIKRCRTDPSGEDTFQCWSGSCDPADGAMRRRRSSSRAELRVARPGSDGPLVRQAASCRATLAKTLDGSSLNPSTTGHRALRQRQQRKRRGVRRSETRGSTEGEKLQTVKAAVIKGGGRGGGGGKTLHRDKEHMKKTNSMYLPSSRCQETSSLVESHQDHKLEIKQNQTCTIRGCP